MSRIRFKALAVSAAALFVAMACGPSTPTASENLAKDQTLTFPLQDDIATFDPAEVSSGVDITFTNEMYVGLYRLDNNLQIQPVIATGKPDVSSDGKTYTFHLRHDAKFSNGDPVKSADVLYSWNRVAHHNGAYGTVMQPVVGYDAATSDKTKDMTGLTATDDYTVKAQLTDAAGYWLSELALWTAAIVDKKVVTAGGEDTWWTKPETAIGAGPFKMTARVPKASMEFQPVSNWWGGSTGALTKIKVEIGVDQASQVKKFESGGYDLVGMANQPPGPDDVLRYKGDPTKRQLLNIYPAARTSWVGFNLTGNSPFAPKPGINPGDPTGGLSSDAGKDGRTAFAQAIDRNQLVDVACAQGATCSAATGGLVAKGLHGYLGDGKDPNGFNKDTAKSTYTKWDPNGSKVHNLVYRYNTSASNTKIAQNLQSQWKANLGVDVQLGASDFPTLIKERDGKKTIIYRGSWGADYDHPQDWFDNLWNCEAAKVGHGGDEGYCNPAMDKTLNQANAMTDINKAVPLYQQAGQTLLNDVSDAVLIYGTQGYLTQKYVKGAGFNSLYDYNWEGIRLLQH